MPNSDFIKLKLLSLVLPRESRTLVQREVSENRARADLASDGEGGKIDISDGCVQWRSGPANHKTVWLIFQLLMPLFLQ